MSLFLVWPLLLTYWFFPNPALLCRKKGYWVFELLTYHYCTCILKGEGSLSEDDYLNDNMIRIVWGLFILNVVSHKYQFGARGGTWNSSDGVKLMKYLSKRCTRLWPFTFWQGRWDCGGETEICLLDPSKKLLFVPPSADLPRCQLKGFSLMLLQHPRQAYTQHKPPTSDQPKEFVHILTELWVSRNHRSRATTYLKWRKVVLD